MPVEPDEALLDLLRVELEQFSERIGYRWTLSMSQDREALREIYQVLISAAGESHGSAESYAWWYGNNRDQFSSLMARIHATPPVGVMDTTPEPPRTAEEIRKQAKDYREMEDAVAQFGRLMELLETPPKPFTEGDKIPAPATLGKLFYGEGVETFHIPPDPDENSPEAVESGDPPRVQ